MKKFISISYLFFTLFTIQALSQLETINEFPREYDSQEILDLTPVWISGNEILVFYKNATKDSIFSRRTTNLGHTWSSQKIEQVGEGVNSFYYDIYLFKTSTDRLIFFWVSPDNIINYRYSDDGGTSWTVSDQKIYGFAATDLSVAEIETNKLILSYSRGIRWDSRLSTDNGESWTDLSYLNIPIIFGGSYRNPNIINLSENGDSLLGVFSSSNSVIYSFLSYDGGYSWSDTNRIFDTRFGFLPYYNTPPWLKAVRDKDKNIWLLFDAKNEIENVNFSQSDLSVLKSTNNGATWQQMKRFTSFIGNDYLTGVTTNGNEILVCFNSSRNKPFNQGYFGIVGQSEDTYTPPILLNQGVAAIDYENEKFIYRALVIDDGFVSSVNLDIENGEYQSQMFDDGMHNDSLANDNIFGNTFPLIPPNSASSNLEAYQIDVNNISLPLNARGVLADVNIDSYQLPAELKMVDNRNNVSIKNPNISIPFRNPGSGGKFDEETFLFSGGFWLSGYSNRYVWSNGVSSSTLAEDYLAGKVGSDPDETINKIYVVSKDHLPFGSAWQNWKNAVSLGAEFYDGDGDGIYNPVDKNWNGTWDTNEDMPPIIGDEIAWCIYNDGLPDSMRRWQAEPQGIEIRQTIFASDDLELENVIFIKYSILNTGTVADILESVYFGIWEDADLGDHTDDLVGCDTLLQSAFCYNKEPDAVYGNNPPAFFSTLLQGPIIETNEISDTASVNFGQLIGSQRIAGKRNIEINSHIFNVGGDPALNDPSNIIEVRNYLLGTERLGNTPNPCTFAYGEVRGGVNCSDVDPRYWFSGDPVTNVGWICKWGRDMRNLVSTGPFELVKDEPQEIIVAYVVGRGTDPLNSITVARENVRRAIEEYQSNFASMTYSAPPATNPVNSYVLYQNYPNPFNPVTTIRYELPQDGQVTIDIFDILGQKVGTIVNEYKRADRYEVTFNSTGLASGVYIYQLRVNDFITSKKMVLLK